MNGDSIAARFIAQAEWQQLPAAVRKKAVMALTDNLSALISGTRTEVSRIAARFASRCLPGNEATVVLHGVRTAAAGAAFANGCAANGLDTDDSARYCYGHAGAQIFPTVLAVAESHGAGGAELLTGMVVGYEIAHRMGRCWHDDHAVYQACGSWGSAACAAASAYLLHLDEDRARNALGIADYHAPNLPMMRDIAHPAMVKHGIGWAAVTGIFAAELAAEGFTAIPSLLNYDKYRNWVDDIGSNYIMTDGIAWKAKGYACCGWAHAAVEGAKTVLDRYGFSAEEIERIDIVTFHEAAALSTELPSTTEEAQFNIAWPTAAMLVCSEIGPEQTLEHSLGDERIRSLAGKVTVRESEELNELCRLFEKGDPRGRFAAEVTVVLQDGRRLESGRVGGGLRFPQEPQWDDSMMEEKFRWLVEPVAGAKLTGRLLELCRRFDTVGDVRELTELLFRVP